MKQILLFTFALACAEATALAQGTINFQSANANAYVAYTYGTPVGAGFKAALYGGPAGALEGGLIQLGDTAPVTAGTGFIVGGGTRTNPTVAGGATGSFQVRVWNGTATTWDAALVGIGGTTAAGKTAVFGNPTGDPTATPPGVPAFLTGWNTPLVLVPEPSAFALFGFSLVMLCSLGRRKPKRT